MSGFEAYPRLYQEKSTDRLTILPRWRSTCVAHFCSRPPRSRAQ
jgi:hypothetical protein